MFEKCFDCFTANEKGSAGVILTLTGVNEDMRQRLASKSRGNSVKLAVNDAL